MTTKIEVKQMSDAIISNLTWIDDAEDSILIQQLKSYRQELIDYPEIYVEGTMIVFPLDPRVK
jgi:hypothetical protein